MWSSIVEGSYYLIVSKTIPQASTRNPLMKAEKYDYPYLPPSPAMHFMKPSTSKKKPPHPNLHPPTSTQPNSITAVEYIFEASFSSGSVLEGESASGMANNTDHKRKRKDMTQDIPRKRNIRSRSIVHRCSSKSNHPSLPCKKVR